MKDDCIDLDEMLSEIAELEKENAELKRDNEGYEKDNARLVQQYNDLQKENTELKTDYEVLSCSVGDFGELQDKLEEEQRKNNGLEEQLTNAKEIIREYINLDYIQLSPCDKVIDLRDKAEQFISEVKK